MILVDSSVWIDFMRGRQTLATGKLETAVLDEEVLLADIVLLELLQGARDDLHAARIEYQLRQFPMIEAFDAALARACARNYRILRSKGRSVRKTTEIMIGTFCIVNGLWLLHQDRDFHPMAEFLGLKIL